MTKATEYMQAAIDHADQRCKELGTVNYVTGWTETPKGKIAVCRVETHRRNTTGDAHYSNRWELNGKRIAAAKIEETLNS